MNPSLLRTITVTAAVTLALLMIPAGAMRFTTEVSWGIEDFAAAAALLFCAGTMYSVAACHTRSARQRIVVASLVLAMLGTIWAELAVGLFT